MSRITRLEQSARPPRAATVRTCRCRGRTLLPQWLLPTGALEDGQESLCTLTVDGPQPARSGDCGSPRPFGVPEGIRYASFDPVNLLEICLTQARSDEKQAELIMSRRQLAGRSFGDSCIQRVQQKHPQRPGGPRLVSESRQQRCRGDAILVVLALGKPECSLNVRLCATHARSISTLVPWCERPHMPLVDAEAWPEAMGRAR